MTKLFITGATGYIGGDALYAIAKAQPNLEITALVRGSDKGAKVASQYPNVKLIYGDLDSADLLKAEAAKADVVLHAAHADHVGAANALVAGLAQKETSGYLIHTSGAGIYGFPDAEKKTFGVHADKIYNDWDGIEEVTSLPDSWIHRKVDKIILAAAEKNPDKIFTAIVAPPTIYGPGRGPDNQRSIQADDYTKAILERGKGFIIGEGKNRWAEVHVQDLSNAYTALVAAALQPNGGSATWNQEGYYLLESGEFVWGDIARAITKIAADKKLIDTAEVDVIDGDAANKLRAYASYLWGTNSRVKAVRARKVLGWVPRQKQSLLDTLPDVVDSEARALGLIKGHAEVASG